MYVSNKRFQLAFKHLVQTNWVSFLAECLSHCLHWFYLRLNPFTFDSYTHVIFTHVACKANWFLKFLNKTLDTRAIHLYVCWVLEYKNCISVMTGMWSFMNVICQWICPWNRLMAPMAFGSKLKWCKVWGKVLFLSLLNYL